LCHAFALPATLAKGSAPGLLLLDPFQENRTPRAQNRADPEYGQARACGEVVDPAARAAVAKYEFGNLACAAQQVGGEFFLGMQRYVRRHGFIPNCCCVARRWRTGHPRGGRWECLPQTRCDQFLRLTARPGGFCAIHSASLFSDTAEGNAPISLIRHLRVNQYRAAMQNVSDHLQS
jgi:hypothetical protein